jgi:hypothetical protein
VFAIDLYYNSKGKEEGKEEKRYRKNKKRYRKNAWHFFSL